MLVYQRVDDNIELQRYTQRAQYAKAAPVFFLKGTYCIQFWGFRL